jgi:hypothetical protein
MDSLFMMDLRQSRAITLAQFRQRGLWDRVREGFAGAVGKLL